MSIAISLSPEIEALLREKVDRQGQDISIVATQYSTRDATNYWRKPRFRSHIIKSICQHVNEAPTCYFPQLSLKIRKFF